MDHTPRRTKSNFRSTVSQTVATAVKNLLMLSFGMTLGFRTILIGGIVHRDSINFEDVTENQISWIGSLSLLTILVGSLLSGVVTEPLGRRTSMQLITIPFVICWLGFYFANQLWQIYVVLAFMGLFGGLVEAPFSTYVSEVTEPRLRGILSLSGSISVQLGASIQFVLGTFFNWRTCALISCSFPITDFILFFFVPESPYWLVKHNKPKRARHALAWLRGWKEVSEIEPEINAIMRKHSEKIGSSVSTLQPFLKKSFIWPFVLLTLLFVLAQFNGVSTLQTYAISIFSTLNVPISSYHAILGLAVSQVVGVSIGMSVIHVVGKRKLTFVTLAGTCICNLVIAIYANLNDIDHVKLIDNEQLSGVVEMQNWAPLGILIALSFIGNCGICVLPWVMLGELYSNETRSVGCGISCAVSYLLNFISNKIFLSMTSGITVFGTYLLHASICFVGILVLNVALPETEGKTLEEITDHFEGISRLSNDVAINKRKLRNQHVNSTFQDDSFNTKL